MVNKVTSYGRVERRLAVAALVLAASCSRELSASEARQKADDYVRAEFHMTNFRLFNVAAAEKPESWIVTYSAKGEATGGPLVVGIDKETGRAHLIEGYQ